MQTLKLGKTTFLYAISTFLRYSVGLILIPIYTSVLSETEYGALETLTVIVQTLLVLLNLGLSNSLIRFFSECEDEAEKDRLVRTSTILVALFSAAFFAAAWPFFRPLSSNLLKDPTQTSLLSLAFTWAIGAALNEQLFAYYRAEQQAGAFVAISIIQFLMLMTLNIAFVWLWGMGIAGVLSGNGIAVWLINGVLLWKFWRSGWDVSRGWVWPLLSFGLPLVFARFGWLMLNSADRYFLAYFRDLAEVGLYGIGYKSGLIIQILVIVPFQLGWGPFVFSRYAENKGKAVREFSSVLTYLTACFTFMAFGLYLFAPEVVALLGAGKYPTAVRVVPFVLAAYLFNAIYYWAGNLFHLVKRTLPLTLIILAGAIVNIGLNYWFVPQFGWLAAAWITVITIGGVGLATLAVSHSFCAVPIQYGRIAKIFLALVPLVALHLLFPPESVELRWVVRLFYLLAYPVFLWLLRFFTVQERAFASALWLRLSHRSSLTT